MKSNVTKLSIVPIMLLAAGVMFLTRCKKEELEDSKNPDIQAVTYSPGDFIWNSQDAADEMVNQALYDIGLASRDLLSDPVIAAALVDVADNTTHHEVDLLSFLDEQDLRDEFRNALADITENDPEAFDDEAYIAENLYNQEEYRAKVLVYNLSNLNLDNTAWIGVGIYLDEDIYDDHIDDNLIWKPSNNVWTVDAIDAIDAINTTHPVFAIVNGIELPDDAVVVDFPEHQEERNTITYPIWNHYTARIDDPYEGSGNSEYAILCTKYDGIGPISTSSVEFSWAPAQIGTTRYLTWTIIDDGFETGNVCSGGAYSATDIGTYEYDGGFTAGKLLMHYCDPYTGFTKEIYCKRKYNHEWYHFSPYSTSNNPTSYNLTGYHPYHTSVRTQDAGTGKGTMSVIRYNY